MKNFLKQIGVGLITAMLTIGLVYGGYSVYADDGIPTRDFADESFFRGTTFYEIQAGYHSVMDDYFDLKIEQFYNLMKDNPTNFMNLPEFLPPEGVSLEDFIPNPEQRESQPCPEENVSTFCVSMGALDLYNRYVFELSAVSDEPLASVPLNESIYDALQTVEVVRDEIAQEIEDAEKIMRATVATYHEFRMAYPMHLQYEEVIKTLMKYRVAIKDVRKFVSRFPEKFVDATSIECE